MTLGVGCSKNDNSFDESRVDAKIAGKHFVSSGVTFSAAEKTTKSALGASVTFDMAKTTVQALINQYAALYTIEFSVSVDGNVILNITGAAGTTLVFPDCLNTKDDKQLNPDTFKIFTAGKRIYFGIKESVVADYYAHLQSTYKITDNLTTAMEKFPVFVHTGNYYSIPFLYSATETSLTISVDKTYVENLIKSIDNLMVSGSEHGIFAGDSGATINTWNVTKQILIDFLDICSELKITMAFEAETSPVVK